MGKTHRCNWYFCTMGNVAAPSNVQDNMLTYDDFKSTVLNDYRVIIQSREVSLLGRREVLTGKAKFGIFGDGKELAQLAMAKFFKPGDFRAGYYRDQTFMFASGLATPQQFFAQLYADPDINNEPFSAGRQMVSHFATNFTDADGNWLPLVSKKNISGDMAPTASQMPRSLGLALASKFFRNTNNAEDFATLSHNGNEVCFCTIGDAATSEGHFWETINAAGVLQVPLAIFVWDDGYGISVPKEYQTTKGSISAALRGFQKKNDTNGLDIYKVKGWDYATLCEVFETGIEKIRTTHVPAIFHVEEITQPQGHSTSGSHERYKSAERLDWEREWDCIKQMRLWILENNIITEDELSDLEDKVKQEVRGARTNAWNGYIDPIKAEVSRTVSLLQELVDSNKSEGGRKLLPLIKELNQNSEPLRRDILKTLALATDIEKEISSQRNIAARYNELKKENKQVYNSLLYSDNSKSASRVQEIKATYDADAIQLNGFEILNKFFDHLFNTNPSVIAFGEDVGKIGDVNQAFSGLQEKHGLNRIFDTGIRELTIIGQGIGLAMRGLKPIAEIQYLDYLLYGLQPLSDDVSTLHYRTKGKQSCPLIVRTRGHRLEGIWHSGSPLGMIINALRGMYVCVPRNMVQAAGMYNTLLQSNDPALVIECLNGYRLKEKLPSNLHDFTVPLGIPEIIKQGKDITIVSYGSMLKIITEAAERLQQKGISCEIIDVQTLLPFDINHKILASLKKTSRILFIDEDVPGGATAYMFNKVMEEQGGYKWLDASPRTVTSKAHRPAYGSDGDYFSKPNTEEIVEVVREMMSE